MIVVTFFYSLANVMIYNIREKRFRATSKKIICACIPNCLSKHATTEESSDVYSTAKQRTYVTTASAGATPPIHAKFTVK